MQTAMKVPLLMFNIHHLKLLGLWTTKRRNFVGVIHTSCVLLFQIFYLISAIISMLHCKGELSCSLESATYVFLIISGIYTFIAYLYNEKLYQDAVAALYNLMDDFRTYSYTIAAEKFTRQVSLGCAIYGSMGALEYLISPLVDYSSCLERNIETSPLICGLPTPGEFPFNPVDGLGYYAAYSFQSVCCLLHVYSLVHPLMFSCCIVYHVISQLKMLQDNLKNICEGQNSEQQRCNMLRQCIKHHGSILDFAELIMAAFRHIVLMHMIMVAIIFSILGIEIIQMYVTTIEPWNLSRYVVLFLGWMINLLCISIVGQKLIDESIAVAEFAYNIPWYNESNQFQRMIGIVILRANKPLVLRSASFELSFQSFANVMSSTYSYLTLLYKLLIVTED